MSVSEAARGVVDESVASTELALGTNGFHLEPRCRICRNDQVRTKVNDLLATGVSYAMVLRALGDDNATLEQHDRVTIDSIRNHTARRFPVQQVARATYREILERRAKQNSVDFIDGVATAITPLAVLETIMVKGYQTLVDELTTVSYRDAMDAALNLHFSRDLFGSDVVRAGRRVGLIVPDGYGRSAGVARGRAFHGRWGPRVGWRVSCCSGEGGPKSLPSFGYRGGPAPGGVDA